MLAICVIAAFASLGHAWAGDNHAGYYYPKPQTREVYVSPHKPLPQASKRARVGFTVGLNAQQKKRAFAPGYHIFAKGAHGQKMIIVTTATSGYDTLYHLRALLASLSADARLSPLFQKIPDPENVNFLDLCRMTGFEQLTISNGVDIAHRIVLR